jgi:hypothetical protein
MRNSGGNQSFANIVAKGGRGDRGDRGNSPCNHGGGGRNGGCGGYGRGGGGGRGSSFQQGVFCQLCGKEGHSIV